MLAGTVSTAIEYPVRFHAVTDNPAAAMGAGWRQGVDGTFETIEHMRLTIDPHFKTLIVHVSAYFTSPIIPLLVHHLPLSVSTHFDGQLELS